MSLPDVSDVAATAPTYADDAYQCARELLFDYLAVAARGAATPAATAARSVLEGPGRAVVDGTGVTGSVSTAALVNGIAGHAIELDDTYEPASLHPGVVVWPVVLALADERDAMFGEVLNAGIAGYDAVCVLGDRLDPGEAYARGFHPTGICGPIGAAVAASSMLGLGPRETAHAIGIAASASSGLLEFLSDGAWTKPFHAGHASASGIMAARLAGAGYTGPASAIEGRLGFLHAFGGRSETSGPLRMPPAGYGVTGTAVKSYPCCRYIHGNLDLLLELLADEDFDAADVESIRCGVLSAGWDLVAHPIDAKRQISGNVDAQFSMPFAAAVAVTHGHATLDDFDRADALAADLRPLMARIDCYRSDDLEGEYPREWAAEVEVTVRGDEVLRRRQASIKGSPTRRLTPDELHAKAEALVGTAAADQLQRLCLGSPDDARVSRLRAARASIGARALR
jgi:2-methylcitrate dehydratase PrpD